MFKTFILALALAALVAGCSSKEKEEDAVIDTVTMDNGVGSDIDSSKLGTFDPRGSDGGNIAGLSTVNFEYDRFSLTSQSREKIAANAEWLRNQPNVSLQIEGHCDSRGSIEYNFTLGERRANAVKSYMVSLGIDSSRLSVISYGEEKPMSEGDSESAHFSNRRANFVPIQ